MWIGVVTLFPEMFDAITKFGVTKRAINNNLIKVECFNPRDFTTDKHQTVDDRPYGGGPGMLMMVKPLEDALQAAKITCKNANYPNPKVIYVSPQGRVLNQQGVMELSANESMIFICGRYEGIDERFIQTQVDEEWSIGDYVLTGGELPAMILVDAVSRFIPGVLGKSESAFEDSFANGLLDCPHYTRPEVYNNLVVPEVLTSGNHKKIDEWRLKQSLQRTLKRRPELLDKLALTNEQIRLLNEIKQEN